MTITIVTLYILIGLVATIAALLYDIRGSA